VIATLLGTASAGVAPAANPEAGTIVRVELELKASHGLHAQLETSDDEMVTLELRRKGRQVTYEVEGEVTEAGLKVVFGRLGVIDVAFTPTNTLSSTEPSEGCVGEPRTLREGIFAGTIDFTGEQEYVRIQASQAEGSMSVISQWECPEGESIAPFAGSSRVLALRRRGAEHGGETASLHVSSRRCFCFFDAGIHHRNSGGGSIFYGAKAERREGLQIVRITSVHGGVGAFVFDHTAGTATLRPPRPFSGRATFERRPGRDLWRGTIQVPLLGADPLRPSGSGFRAALYPEYHFD
jgi:hypothetical protein